MTLSLLIGCDILYSAADSERQPVSREEQNGLISDMTKDKTDNGFKLVGAVLIDTSKGLEAIETNNVSCVKLIYTGSSIRSGYLDFKRIDFNYNPKTKEVSSQVDTTITVSSSGGTFVVDKYSVTLDERYIGGGLDIRIEE